MNPQQLICPDLPAFSPDDWDEAIAAFAEAPSCHLHQSWLPVPDPGFRPATVFFGLREGLLWVLAELIDDDVYNDATGNNQADYNMGDIFEILLRPTTQPAYYEFHVTPENHTFQLRLPKENCLDGIAPDAGVEELGDMVLDEPIVTSRTRLTPSGEGWQVLVSVPLARLVETGAAPAPGDLWHFSFCRYDCTRGQADPVYSSSSVHRRARYHDQEGWGRFTLWSEGKTA